MRAKVTENEYIKAHNMGRKEKAAPPEVTCGECSHITPTDEYLSVKEHKPILGSCPFSKYLRLLSDRICEHFKLKNK